ncbi:hypothetical protein K439DRAFT_1639027 [Ramaria rubella]|nr:hypothetical protein K439DRAFT_1639027 [Ramaria rubella]
MNARLCAGTHRLKTSINDNECTLTSLRCYGSFRPHIFLGLDDIDALGERRLTGLRVKV